MQPLCGYDSDKATQGFPFGGFMTALLLVVFGFGWLFFVRWAVRKCRNYPYR